MKTQEIAGPAEITRRAFCNRVVMTSVGLGLAARNLGQSVSAQTPRLAYPPKKIEGAESVMPGSFLNFSYPRAHDPAVLVRAADGEYFAYSRKCPPWMFHRIRFAAPLPCLSLPPWSVRHEDGSGDVWTPAATVRPNPVAVACRG